VSKDSSAEIEKKIKEQREKKPERLMSGATTSATTTLPDFAEFSSKTLE